MRMVYGALAQGRSYMVNRLEGECANLEFFAFRGAERWYAGDIASLRDGPITLKVNVGSDAPVRLIHNGKEALTGKTTLLTTVNTSGVYRMESTKSQAPWVMSNPIYITR
jgi:hypothetical protein